MAEFQVGSGDAMYYEQDYIMRLIRQVIRALIGTLLNKKTMLEYDMPVNRQQTTGDDPLAGLIFLADTGKICEAENKLYDILESGSDAAYHTALMFYDHLNAYTDSFLEEHDFSREDIRQGVLETAKKMGALYAAAAIMDTDSGSEDAGFL